MKKTNKDICCEIVAIHDREVEEVKTLMPNEKDLSKLEGLFKTISDPTRLRILWALSQKELCVCDISSLLSMSQSAISHQLRVLKDNELVKYRKAGKVVYYSLKDDHVWELYTVGMDHVKEEE